jgi:iron-sulfur cluster assembly accessory protein
MTILPTEKALMELRHVKEGQGLPDSVYVRVSIEAAGCGGFVYGLKFEEQEQFDEDSDSICLDEAGVIIVTSQQLEPILAETVLDFTEVENRRGFTFKNPNETKFCEQCPQNCYNKG